MVISFQQPAGVQWRRDKEEKKVTDVPVFILTVYTECSTRRDAFYQFTFVMFRLLNIAGMIQQQTKQEGDTCNYLNKKELSTKF